MGEEDRTGRGVAARVGAGNAAGDARRALVALCALVLAAAPMLGVVPPAAAHADLVSSSPSAGSTSDAPLREVSFTFSEAIAEPAYVAVLGPDGDPVTTGEPQVRGAVVTQRVRPVAAGVHTMAYRVVSDDGHPINGEVGFTLAPGSVVAATTRPSGRDRRPAADGAAGAESGRSAPEDAPTEQAAPEQAAPEQAAATGFWSAYAPYLVAGAALLVLAAGAVLLSRRSRS